MFCMKCGKENVPNARFCEHCGANMNAGGQGITESLQAHTSGLFSSAAEPIATAVSFYIGLSGLAYWLMGALLWVLATSVGIVGTMNVPMALLGGAAAQGAFAAAWFMLMAVSAQILGAFLLSCAYGLWHRRQWGRRLGLVLMIISAVLTFLSLGFYERVAGPIFIVTTLSVVVNALIIFWLLHPVTKEAFHTRE